MNSLMVIEKVIFYSYTGEFHVTTGTVISLLTLAELLQEKYLTDSCIAFIAKR